MKTKVKEEKEKMVNYTMINVKEGKYPIMYKCSAKNTQNVEPDDFNPYNTQIASMVFPASEPNSGPVMVHTFSL